jgi:hypothetical protein
MLYGFLAGVVLTLGAVLVFEWRQNGGYDHEYGDMPVNLYGELHYRLSRLRLGKHTPKPTSWSDGQIVLDDMEQLSGMASVSLKMKQEKTRAPGQAFAWPDPRSK